MNSKAIADAIAARFDGVSAVNGSETRTVQLATASMPNTIARGVYVLVFPPTAETEIGVSRMRDDEMDFVVRLLWDPLNYPTRTDWLYAWWDALRDRVEADMDLGLPAYVSWARVINMRALLDGFTYGDVISDMVEMTVRVHVSEVVTTVAI